MINNVYQKQHHRVVARPRSTSYTYPASNRFCQVNHQNVNLDLNYYTNQYSNGNCNNRTIIQKDFNEYDRNLNAYNNSRRNNFVTNQENIYFDTNANNYNNYNHNVCTCNHSFSATNNQDMNIRRNFSLHNNTNYYQKNDNLIDFHYHDSDLKWKGILPSDHYKTLVGPNPHVVYKKPAETIQLNQRVNFKNLIPPSTPPPGDLIIKHEPDRQLPVPPPLYVRQQPVSEKRPKTAIYRQNPPKMPPIIPEETLVIPGRVLPSPPRQVIVERLPEQPDPPPNIIIEKWLDYEPQKRRVRYIPPDNSNINIAKAQQNVLIQWEPFQCEIKKQYTDLGCEVVDPYEYAQKYGLEMVSTPHNQSVELTGDVHALKLVDMEKLNITKKIEGGTNRCINSF